MKKISMIITNRLMERVFRSKSKRVKSQENGRAGFWHADD